MNKLFPTGTAVRVIAECVDFDSAKKPHKVGLQGTVVYHMSDTHCNIQLSGTHEDWPEWSHDDGLVTVEFAQLAIRQPEIIERVTIDAVYTVRPLSERIDYYTVVGKKATDTEWQRLIGTYSHGEAQGWRRQYNEEGYESWVIKSTDRYTDIIKATELLPFELDHNSPHVCL